MKRFNLFYIIIRLFLIAQSPNQYSIRLKQFFLLLLTTHPFKIHYSFFPPTISQTGPERVQNKKQFSTYNGVMIEPPDDSLYVGHTKEQIGINQKTKMTIIF